MATNRLSEKKKRVRVHRSIRLTHVGVLDSMLMPETCIGEILLNLCIRDSSWIDLMLAPGQLRQKCLSIVASEIQCYPSYLISHKNMPINSFAPKDWDVWLAIEVANDDPDQQARDSAEARAVLQARHGFKRRKNGRFKTTYTKSAASLLLRARSNII